MAQFNVQTSNGQREVPLGVLQHFRSAAVIRSINNHQPVIQLPMITLNVLNSLVHYTEQHWADPPNPDIAALEQNFIRHIQRPNLPKLMMIAKEFKLDPLYELAGKEIARRGVQPFDENVSLRSAYE